MSEQDAVFADIITPANTSDAAAIAEVVARSADPQVIELGEVGDRKVRAILRTRAFKVESIKPLLDEFATAPERKSGTATLKDLKSFIAHVKRFADADSALFADPTRGSPSIQAVLDYHRQDGAPRFGAHRSRYEFPLSDEWKKWSAASREGASASQLAFAEFIEDRIGDIVAPTGSTAEKALAEALGLTFATPSRLLELSRGLSVRVEQTIGAAHKLDSGESRMVFSTEHKDEAGTELKIPGAFLIAIPVFESGVRYTIPVKLRYRVDKGRGSVSWSLILHHREQVFDDALREACELAAKETGLPLFVGSPE